MYKEKNKNHLKYAFGEPFQMLLVMFLNVLKINTIISDVNGAPQRNFPILIIQTGVGEMVQWLRAFAALPEDPPIPNTHLIKVAQALWDPKPSSGLSVYS